MLSWLRINFSGHIRLRSLNFSDGDSRYWGSLFVEKKKRNYTNACKNVFFCESYENRLEENLFSPVRSIDDVELWEKIMWSWMSWAPARLQKFILIIVSLKLFRRIYSHLHENGIFRLKKLTKARNISSNSISNYPFKVFYSKSDDLIWLNDKRVGSWRFN